ncbi:hypothetical protein [Streptomyces sp. GC420]|uniref:hypothetical protein n=1 Tax=Streptomyces sp. GC420 TaxID=2697568 RepID=UPI0014150385|nr:hypothetical protein [Streptomyces sp. GC420]NBM18723.1 hypothetical protein [Streptomyces sp. GC420]
MAKHARTATESYDDVLGPLARAIVRHDELIDGFRRRRNLRGLPAGGTAADLVRSRHRQSRHLDMVRALPPWQLVALQRHLSRIVRSSGPLAEAHRSGRLQGTMFVLGLPPSARGSGGWPPDRLP